MTPERARILREIAIASVSAERATGCPALASAAQAIVESGWLAHMPPGSNNCFGIKDTDRYPGASYAMTTEWQNGKPVLVRQAFEKYPALADCFIDHGRLITGGFGKPNLYARAWRQYVEDHDVDRWIESIAVHYAPGNKHYPEVIRNWIHSPEIIAAIKAANQELS